MREAILYARKSTESEDRQVLSVDSQIRELQALAGQRGITVNTVLTETKSAKAPGRPVFGELMQRVHRGHVRAIICWKMDRLARNHLDTGAILQALADGKLEEVVTSDRTYTRDGNDRFMGNFELGMATKFIDDLRANVKRGNRARLARGWINYLPPIGYMNDRATKTIVKDPERFDHVRSMFDLILTGTMRPSQVVDIANKRWGFRTRRFKRIGGKPLSRSVFFSMLGNPFYSGVIRLRSGETFLGAHPAMITRGEFDRVQQILGRTGRPRPQHHTFSFTGLMKCGGCGGSITAEEHVKRMSGRRYVYYRCSRKNHGAKCSEPPVSEADLVAQLLDTFSRTTISAQARAWMVRHIQKGLRLEDERRDAVRETVDKALGDIRREMEQLVSLRIRDLVSDEMFVQKKREIDENRVMLEHKLREPSRSVAEVQALTLATIDFGSRIKELFENGTGVQKRMILETVGVNYLLKGRKVTFSYKKPFRILAREGADSDWCTSADDVRTWLQDTTEYFALPNLDAVGAMAAQAAA
jgi:DNA invertase Pin-like site-specific DNA recombinase